MDWAYAISRNRQALLAIVAAIVALLGGREGAGPVSRRLRSAALASLRPAEAAARRLIVVAARGLVVALRPPALGRASFDKLRTRSARADERPPAFPLFDRRKRFGRLIRPAGPCGVPRIRMFWSAPRPAAAAPAPPAQARPDPDALVDAARLRLRLLSLEAALADLPRQARRLARVRARRASGVRPCAPLRPGRPPGHRLRPDRDVDAALRDCDALARAALRSDTS